MEGQSQFDWRQTKIGDEETFVAAVLPQELRPLHVDGAARNQHFTISVIVGVRKIDRKQFVARLRRRTQKQRPSVFDFEFEVREKARAVVKNALLAELIGMDVAVMVEDAEGIALF